MPGDATQDNQETMDNASGQKQTEKAAQPAKQGLFGHKKHAEEGKVKELTETLQRLQAEFENYQKRNAKENSEFRSFANAKLLEQMLLVLDSINEGLEHEPANKGLEMVKKQLVQVLHSNGVQKMEIKTGDKFDPHQMEAMLSGTDEKLDDGAVIEVMQKGYWLSGKVLRFAKVKVNSIENKGISDMKNGVKGEKQEIEKEKQVGMEGTK